jgi:hypothetical protein
VFDAAALFTFAALPSQFRIVVSDPDQARNRVMPNRIRAIVAPDDFGRSRVGLEVAMLIYSYSLRGLQLEQPKWADPAHPKPALLRPK